MGQGHGILRRKARVDSCRHSRCPASRLAARHADASHCEIPPRSAHSTSACSVRIRWHVDCESGDEGHDGLRDRSLPVPAGPIARRLPRGAPSNGAARFRDATARAAFSAPSTSRLALRGVVRPPRPIHSHPEVSMSTDRTDPTPPIDSTRRTLVQGAAAVGAVRPRCRACARRSGRRAPTSPRRKRSRSASSR